MAKYTQSEIDGVEIPTITFSDITKDSAEWYKNYIYFAKSKGIIKGYADGTFGAEKEINFAEASKIIVNTLLGDTGGAIKGDWWLPFVEKLKIYNIDENIKEKLEEGTKNITRGEMAHIINIILENPDSFSSNNDTSTTTDTQSNDEVDTTGDTTEGTSESDDEVDDTSNEEESDDTSVGDEESNSKTIINQIVTKINDDAKNNVSGGDCKIYANKVFSDIHINDIDINVKLPKTATKNENGELISILDELYEWKLGAESSLIKKDQYVKNTDNKDKLKSLLESVKKGDILQMFWNPLNSKKGCFPHTIIFLKDYNKSLSFGDSNSKFHGEVKLHTKNISYFINAINIDTQCEYLYYDKTYSNYGATLYRLKDQD